MNQLTTHKRKISQFSLTKESQEILETFSKKYGTQKSIVVDRALQLLAAKYHMSVIIHYEISEPIDKIKKVELDGKEISLEEAIKIAKTKWID